MSDVWFIECDLAHICCQEDMQKSRMRGSLDESQAVNRNDSQKINEISSSGLSLREKRGTHPVETSMTDANWPGINI
jgi:hypothetical protein